jgi:decaprenylphospho-beta-D-ribofuranose 2-oxidase
MSDWLSPMAVDAPETTERREGWGMASQALCEVRYPGSEEDIRAALEHARASGLTVLPWGNGRSYGDAALNESNVLLDTSRMTQIVDWDPESGVVTCQPGVTLEKLWKHILRDGWWPPVVSGTMLSTLGGLVAANAHGKNNVMHGPIGDHVVGFTLVTGAGETRQVTAESDPDLFHAAIGGMGWLGVFTSVTLQMKRVYSGQLEVLPLCEPNLQGMFDAFARCESAGLTGFPRAQRWGAARSMRRATCKSTRTPMGARQWCWKSRNYLRVSSVSFRRACSGGRSNPSRTGGACASSTGLALRS